VNERELFLQFLDLVSLVLELVLLLAQRLVSLQRRVCHSHSLRQLAEETNTTLWKRQFGDRA
jgi:hypothetical protein